MSDGAQTTRTFFFVEGTHLHWQATAEQFFFSKFINESTYREAIKLGSAREGVKRQCYVEVSKVASFSLLFFFCR